MVVKSFALSLLLAASVSALSVPSTVQTFYNGVKNGGCQHFAGNKNNLKDGKGTSGFGFCTDAPNVVYLTGRNSLGDMDVDCDGSNDCPGNPDPQSGTTFDDILSSKYGIKTLNAGVHSFSVLGTSSVDIEKTTAVRPLALVAVVCGNQLFYSVWGDTNGDDDDNATGEASYALARMCFPNENLGGNNGHDAHDVLYLAFTGDDAVVGPKDANWKAKSASEFQASLKAFGDKVLAKKLGSAPPGSGNPPPPPPGKCEWAGHCAGDKCKTADDCDGDLDCKNGVCGGGSGGGPVKPPPTCSWPGHCAGASCGSDDDCDGDLSCQSGKCAA